MPHNVVGLAGVAELEFQLLGLPDNGDVSSPVFSASVS